MLRALILQEMTGESVQFGTSQIGLILPFASITAVKLRVCSLRRACFSSAIYRNSVFEMNVIVLTKFKHQPRSQSLHS
jgi:hypothetical protein